MSDVIVTSLSNLKNEVQYGNYHTFPTDEPLEAGGEDAGPDPYTLLLADKIISELCRSGIYCGIDRTIV